jgi:hypothetical protein
MQLVYLRHPYFIGGTRPWSTPMAELAQGLWESLAGRHTNERTLVRGGMAVVS